MQNKYIVALAIILIIWGGFLFFRSFKEESDLTSHHESQYQRIIDAAQKSPSAGLAQMGRALNRYYEKNASYPVTLTDLYPEFIPVKDFITTIKWEYEPAGDDFSLTKSINRGGDVMVASINKTLTPKPGSGTQMVVAKRIATPKPRRISRVRTPSGTKKSKSAQPAASGAETAKNAVQTPKESVSSASDTTAGGTLDMMDAVGKMLATSSGSNTDGNAIRKPPANAVASRSGARPLFEQDPRIISVVEGEIGSGISRRTGELFLVWKDENGVLGFGNVEYPVKEQLSIYRSGRWYAIQQSAAPTIAPLPSIVEDCISAGNLMQQALVRFREEKDSQH